jgi:hypothetical protein
MPRGRTTVSHARIAVCESGGEEFKEAADAVVADASY